MFWTLGVVLFDHRSGKGQLAGIAPRGDKISLELVSLKPV